MIDGISVATGTAVSLGVTEDFTMTFSGPGINANDVIRNDIEAGEYYGIAIDTGRISQEQMVALKTKLETTKTKLETEDFEGLTKDDILGDLLFTTALAYHAELDVMDYVQAKTMNVLAIRLPSVALFSSEVSVQKVFGTPMSISAGGLAMDADRIMTMVKSLDGDTEKPKQFFLSSGSTGSALEHSVPEQLFSTPDNPAEGISAVKALKLANDQGIPIYTINEENINTILPQLQIDNDDKAEIINAVNAGMVVTTSQSEITYNGWTGIGYIVIDPNTGAGGYMISGGMSGALILGALLFVLAFLFVLLALACVSLTGPAAAACILLVSYHAIAAILGGIATLYGKDKLDEFMNCLASVAVGEAISTAIQKIIEYYLFAIPPVILLVLAGLTGHSVGVCIEQVFYDWDKIYN